MDNPLKNLKIEYWYHATLILSSAILISSLVFEMRDISVNGVRLCALGVLFISLGEWVNHPFQSALMHLGFGGLGTLSGHPRKNNGLGVALCVFGFAFVLIGIVKLASFEHTVREDPRAEYQPKILLYEPDDRNAQQDTQQNGVDNGEHTRPGEIDS